MNVKLKYPVCGNVEDLDNYILNAVSFLKNCYEAQCAENFVNTIISRNNGVTDPYPDFKHDKDSIWILKFTGGV